MKGKKTHDKTQHHKIFILQTSEIKSHCVMLKRQKNVFCDHRKTKLLSRVITQELNFLSGFNVRRRRAALSISRHFPQTSRCCIFKDIV